MRHSTGVINCMLLDSTHLTSWYFYSEPLLLDILLVNTSLKWTKMWCPRRNCSQLSEMQTSPYFMCIISCSNFIPTILYKLCWADTGYVIRILSFCTACKLVTEAHKRLLPILKHVHALVIYPAAVADNLPRSIQETSLQQTHNVGPYGVCLREIPL